MPEKTKVPARTVLSDDFVVEVDGVPYYPHAGESVTFVGRMTTNDLMRSMKLQRIDLNADNADEQIGEVRAFVFGQLMDVLGYGLPGGGEEEEGVARRGGGEGDGGVGSAAGQGAAASPGQRLAE